MEKRVSYESYNDNGVTVYRAIIQIKVLACCWVAVKVIEDTVKWYVDARAEECLYYLEDEKYESFENRCEIPAPVSERCCEAV